MYWYIFDVLIYNNNAYLFIFPHSNYLCIIQSNYKNLKIIALILKINNLLILHMYRNFKMNDHVLKNLDSPLFDRSKMNKEADNLSIDYTVTLISNIEQQIYLNETVVFFSHKFQSEASFLL